MTTNSYKKNLSAQADGVLCTTFSIVARDPATGALGVAVASKAFAVGALVPWVKPGVGAIATQAYTSTHYGSKGLQLLSQGVTVEKALHSMLEDDPLSEKRQIGMVDASGRTAAHTGKECLQHALHIQDHDMSCQGNLLASPKVVESMTEMFLRSSGRLEQRLLAALKTGQRYGGDRRGRQSAALLVYVPDGVSAHQGIIDLRVDDDDCPIVELERLLGLYYLYYTPPEGHDLLPLDASTVRRIKKILKRMPEYIGSASGHLTAEDIKLLEHLLWKENLTARTDTETIDRRKIEHLERVIDRPRCEEPSS